MSQTPVRQRILKTAFDLFYRQGYRATGINQIIAESGAAKASFYDHFPSKEELLHTYLHELAAQELEDMRAEVDRHLDPRDRFFAVIRMIGPWFRATAFRGCPFQNAVAEVPCGDPGVHEAARLHRENVRGLLAEVTRDLVASDARLVRLDQGEIVETYLLLLEGTIVLAVAYQDLWPVAAAERSLERALRP